MNFYHFPRALSPEQEHELKQDCALFSEVLEKQAIVPPDFLAGMVARLRGALDGLQLSDYERLRQNAQVAHNLVHFTHDAHAILNLPWQEAIGGADHLFFSRGAALRDKGELPTFPVASDGPLRILVMVAAPETGGESGRLRYEDEQMQIAEAFGQLLRRGDIEIHFTADGSEQALRQALDAPRYDIFHFSGHSEYAVADWLTLGTEGFLLLEDERSMAVSKLPATTFAALLNERPDKRPSLVFLSSCQSAQGGTSGGYSGVTAHLLEAGIPGVVAMSHSVADVFATLFAAQFYKNIAEGLSVPLAFSKALKTSREGNPKLKLPPEFWQSQSLIPQLYLTQNLQTLTKSAKAGKQRQDQFWQTGRLREKLQKIHRFAGKEDKDFIFIGRRREQKVMRQYLEEAAPVYLQGQGGIGKTALAVHTAERLVLADPDEAQVFMFDENSFRIGQVTDELIAFLQNEQKQILLAHQIKSMDKAWDKFLTALQEVINRSHPVFIFDNLESFQSPDGGGGDFLPEYGMEWNIIQTLAEVGLPLILTGRYPLSELPNLRTVPLHEPSRSDFTVKCRYLTISEKIPPGEAGKPVFETLFRSFGGNYRALEYFDQLYREKKDDFGEVLETLEDFIEKHRADPKFPLTRMSENLVFERLLGLLDAPARRVLGLLVHFRRPVLPLAVEMQDAALTDVAATLAHLSGLTLAEKSTGSEGHAFFYVPTLTRLLLERAEVIASDFSDQKAGEYYEYVDENINHTTLGDLQEAFFHFLQSKDLEKVNKTGGRLSNFLYNNSQYQNALLVVGQTYETCGELTAGSVLNRLGQIFELFGEPDNALFYFEKNLQKYRKTGDLAGEGVTLGNIGLNYRRKGDNDSALKYYEQSLKIQQQTGNRAGEGAILNNLATTAHAKGDYDTALRYLEQSLTIRQQIGDRKGEGMTLNNLATTAYAKGEDDTALRYLEQSLKIAQQIGDRAGEGTTLNNISQIHQDKGDYDTALRYLEQSLKIRQQIGDRKGEGATLNNISQIYDAKGEYDTALRYLEQSLKIRQQIGDRAGEGTTLNNISQIHQDKGDYDTALRYLEQSLKIRQQIGDRKGEGATLNNISQIYDAKGEYDTALRYLEQSLKIAQQIGDISGMATTLHNMGTMLFEQNRPEEAVPLLLQAYQIFQKIGSPTVRVPAGYLEAIIKQIGEARFQEIVAGMGGAP